MRRQPVTLGCALGAISYLPESALVVAVVAAWATSCIACWERLQAVAFQDGSQLLWGCTIVRCEHGAARTGTSGLHHVIKGVSAPVHAMERERVAGRTNNECILGTGALWPVSKANRM